MIHPRRMPARRRSSGLSVVLAMVLVLAVPSASAEPLGTVPAGFASRTARVGKVSIHYVMGGSGPPLLLVHGWPETWYEWRKVMPLLAQRYTVIAADLRGMGDSSQEADGYDKKTLANDLYGLMLQLGHKRVTLVGHDWGGPVAYAYAAQHRDAVDRLVMVEGSPFGPWIENPNVFWFFDFLRLPGYAERLLAGRERIFLRYFYDNEAFHAVPGTFTEDSIDVYSRAYERPGRMTATYGLYRSIPDDIRDVGESAKTPLSIPVLAIGAEKGAGAFVGEGARRVASSVQTVVFRATGHFIPEERPEALVETILKFVADEPLAAEWRPTE